MEETRTPETHSIRLPSIDLQERTLRITNLHEKVTKELLNELFMQAGPVVNVVRKPDFAFIEFEHKETVGYALALMNGISLFDQELYLQPKIASSDSYKFLNTLRTYEKEIALNPLNWHEKFGDRNKPISRHTCEIPLKKLEKSLRNSNEIQISPEFQNLLNRSRPDAFIQHIDVNGFKLNHTEQNYFQSTYSDRNMHLNISSPSSSNSDRYSNFAYSSRSTSHYDNYYQSNSNNNNNNSSSHNSYSQNHYKIDNYHHHQQQQHYYQYPQNDYPKHGEHRSRFDSDRRNFDNRYLPEHHDRSRSSNPEYNNDRVQSSNERFYERREYKNSDERIHYNETRHHSTYNRHSFSTNDERKEFNVQSGHYSNDAGRNSDQSNRSRNRFDKRFSY